MQPTPFHRTLYHVGRRLLPAVVALLLTVIGGSACTGSPQPQPSDTPDKTAVDGQANAPAKPSDTGAGTDAVGDGPAGSPIFLEQAAELGLAHTYDNGATGERYFPETAGGGVGIFDADGDGDLDVYLTQAVELGPGGGGGAGRDDGEGEAAGQGESDGDVDPSPTSPAKAPRDALFLNQLRETGTLAFVDATEAAGVPPGGYGMGVAAGDYDNDGDLDLFVSNAGPNVLLRNDGDARFEDVTEAAGVSDERWSTSAAWFDYDRDGWLDLYVANYVDFSVANHKPCFAANGSLDYCGPLSFDPLPDRLYRNLGDGRFEDVTAAAGIGAAYGAGLGVVTADFDGDGWLDVYVANDGMDNQLWMNQEGRRFENRALLAGVAYNAEGVAEAGMGVVTEDLDEDGDLDLFMTHLAGETNTLYLGDGAGNFSDATQRAGLGAASVAHTGFGVAAHDFDGDGTLDLVIANGAVKIPLDRLGTDVGDASTSLEAYREPDLYFRGTGGGFEAAPNLGGPALAEPQVSRGLAPGDLDEDGDPDLIIVDTNSPVRLLVNESGPPERWVGLRLLASQGRDAYGARVAFVMDDGSRVSRRLHAEGSYLGSQDPRILLALTEGRSVASLEVGWASGETEVFDGGVLAENDYTTLEQGSGEGVGE